MSWLPVLTCSSLVDRNPNNEEYVRHLLCDFLELAESFVPDTSSNEERNGRILVRFCGQARQRWHYGIAHSILSFNERNFPDYVRNSRTILQLYQSGIFYPKDRVAQNRIDLWYFDMVEMWHGCFAIRILVCSTMGAFLISYNTPTVGLGCRSGGYMVYGIAAAICLLLDMLGWFVIGKWPAKNIPVGCLSVVVTLCEIGSSSWIIYVILAQTFGFYNSCHCKSSVWGLHVAGYTDFAGTNTYREDFDITKWWITGTVLGSLPLLTIIHTVYQWATQSFLWTQDYQKAINGLWRVRTWRRVFHRQLAHGIFIKAPYRIFNMKYKGLSWRRWR